MKLHIKSEMYKKEEFKKYDEIFIDDHDKFSEVKYLSKPVKYLSPIMSVSVIKKLPILFVSWI